MMLNKIKTLIVIFLFFSGCQKSTENSKELILNNSGVNTELKRVLDNYIKTNPLKFYRLKGKNIIESGFSYPSYHLYFKRTKADTIFSIVQFPNYNNSELEGTTGDNENETIYKSINHKGWLMYKEKYPLIIFDNNNYSSNLIKENKLSLKIPDSLKAGYNNQHIKFVKWDYKIKNGKLEKINLVDNIHTHPSRKE